MSRTNGIRKEEKSLFITLTAPHGRPSQCTVSRWIKTVLKEAGIDTALFSAGSTRSASTSKAERGGAPIEDIMKAAGWVRSSTFTTYYNKPLSTGSQFQQTVLQM